MGCSQRPHNSSDSPTLAHPPLQFLQFKLKVVPVELKRFEDRVEFTGNPSKNDVSFTLHKVQLEDTGLYNCYVMNPPDRHKGHGQISLQVLTEGQAVVPHLSLLACSPSWKTPETHSGTQGALLFPRVAFFQFSGKGKLPLGSRGLSCQCWE